MLHLLLIPLPLFALLIFACSVSRSSASRACPLILTAGVDFPPFFPLCPNWATYRIGRWLYVAGRAMQSDGFAAHEQETIDGIRECYSTVMRERIPEDIDYKLSWYTPVQLPVSELTVL